jgi:hypothetical protein
MIPEFAPERAFTIEVILQENVSGDVRVGIDPSGIGWQFFFEVLPDFDCIRKAIYLMKMKFDGPEIPVVCPIHMLPDQPDAWDECFKVRVYDALMGLDCIDALI